MIHRRIVTDGSVFRLQLKMDGTDWSFYALTYPTIDQARAMMEKWNAADAVEASTVWTVVEPEQVPA